MGGLAEDGESDGAGFAGAIAVGIVGPGVGAKGHIEDSLAPGAGKKGLEHLPGSGTFITVEAAHYVSVQGMPVAVSYAGIGQFLAKLEVGGKGLLISNIPGPLVAQILGDAAGADNGDGVGKLAFEYLDAGPYLAQGHIKQPQIIGVDGGHTAMCALLKPAENEGRSTARWFDPSVPMATPFARREPVERELVRRSTS